jgi:protein AroM
LGLVSSRLGLITVGQSPRNDIVPAMSALIGPSVEVIEKGALDNLSPAEVKSLAPAKDQSVLCTRMASGEQVVVSKEGVIPLVQERIRELDNEGVDLILLLCTGHFPVFDSRVLVLAAQAIVDRCIQALIDERHTLGLVVPLPEQEEVLGRSLKKVTPRIKTVSASPYGVIESLEAAAERLAREEPDLVVMHCMGYNRDHRRIFRRATGKPVVVANSIVARTVSELLAA